MLYEKYFILNSKRIGYKYGWSGLLLSLYELMNSEEILAKELYKKFQLILNYTLQIYYEMDFYLEEYSFAEVSDFLLILDYFTQEGFLDENDLNEIYLKEDEVLIKHMNILLIKPNYHLVSGVLSLSYYFLNRYKQQQKHKKQLEITICYIEKISYNCDKGWFWKNTILENNVYLGNIHGSLSIIRFLHKCIMLGIDPKKCNRIINYGLTYIINNINYNEKGLNIFKEEKSSHQKTKRIFSYAYGSFNIIYGLLMYQPEKLNKRVLNFITNTSLEVAALQIKDVYIDGFSIAYGSIGVSIMFKELYFKYKRAKYLTASEYWYSYTKKNYNINQFVKENEFLTGNSGILFGLNYLKNNNTSNEEIKNFLFL